MLSQIPNSLCPNCQLLMRTVNVSTLSDPLARDSSEFCDNCGFIRPLKAQPGLGSFPRTFQQFQQAAAGAKAQQQQQQQGVQNPMSPACKIWYDSSIDGYRVVTPFRKDFIDLFKGLVPISDRSWDPEQKIWTITERFLNPTISLIENIYKVKPTVLTKQQAQQAQTPPAVKVESLDLALARFFRLLPYEAAQKAYRLAALELHPDRGGSMDKMSSLNSLWTKIEKELYAKG